MSNQAIARKSYLRPAQPGERAVTIDRSLCSKQASHFLLIVTPLSHLLQPSYFGLMKQGIIGLGLPFQEKKAEASFTCKILSLPRPPQQRTS